MEGSDTSFDEDDQQTLEAANTITLDTCRSIENVFPTNEGIIPDIKESWEAGGICASIQVPSQDGYLNKMLVLDNFGQYNSVPLKKYIFKWVDNVVRLYISDRLLNATVEGYVNPFVHSTTKDRGFLLSAMLVLCQQKQFRLPLPDDELTCLKHTMNAICELYCGQVSKTEHVLKLEQHLVVQRERTFCGLYHRTLSPGQSTFYITSTLDDRKSIFPVPGKLGPVMIKDHYIFVTLCWGDREPKPVRILHDIGELNYMGCYFSEEGIVPAGKVERVPTWFRRPVVEVVHGLQHL
jgi:hypothetical protein